MRAIWGNYDDILSKGIDNQVVNLSIDWKAPVHFDEILAITVKTVKIGTSSYTLQIEFYNYESQKIIASATITYVMVSAREFKKIEIPMDFREPLEKGAAGKTIDHAGSTR